MVYRGGQIINIAGTTPVDDPEYRYKMPAVFGKIEGSGNGIKTVLPNISDVALSLHRQPGEVNKFFGTELGAQSRYSADTDRAIVNGAHTDATLQELVHRYIEKFVLCPNCRLPESEYKIKNDIIWHRCAACGAKEMVDMSHKLVNYILAENKKSKKEGKKDKKKKDKKSKDDSDDDKKKAKKEKKAEKKAKKEAKKAKKAASAGSGGENDYIKDAIEGKKNDEDDFGSSGSESEEHEVGVDDEGALKLAVDATRDFILGAEEFSDDDLVNYVTNQQMASALKSFDKVRILVQAAFTKQFYEKKEVSIFAPALRKITNGNRIMERHLIAAVESLCVKKPKNFAVMLKQLYDEDVLEEDTILEWADQGRSEYTLDSVDEDHRAVLRGEAEPVIVWLQEAESEDESSSEED